jgi:hypothetical protein
MTKLATHPADAPGVLVVARANDFQHKCPVVDEIDRGNLTVWWVTTDRTIELHSLRDYLNTWADTATTHEDLVTAIAAALTWAGVAGTGARFTGRTAGMDVEATANPTGATRALLREPLDTAGA